MRQLFAQLPEAKIRGYHPRRFSFNKPGGRCEACEGNGQKKIEMHFLPDVWVECDVCHGSRYNPETLAVRYKGRSIADLLEMRVSEALELFANIPKIRRILQTLADVVEERLHAYPQHFEVAVLGCAVNGPGEAGDADFGIAGGRDVGFVYAHGRVLKKVSSDILVDELFHEIDRWIADGMYRPKRLKMAKPAALAMAEASMIPLE